MSKLSIFQKVLSLVLTLLFVFSLFIIKGELVYAGSQNKGDEIISISPETNITNNNIYDVLDYLGVDRNNFEKTSIPPKNSITLTVGELSNLINNTSQNQTITNSIVDDTSSHELGESDAIGTYATTYTSTKYRYDPIGSATIRYSATGRYTIYDVPAPGEVFYWTQALGGDIVVDDSAFGTAHSIRIISCITSIESRALKLSYNYYLDHYIALEIGILKTHTQPVQGYKLWATP